MNKKRVTIRVNETVWNFLNGLENKSQFINDSIYLRMNDPSNYLNRLNSIESRIQHLDIEKVELTKEKNRLIDEINHLNSLKDFRPDSYEDTTKVLLSLDQVTEDDLLYQSNVLGVSLEDLKIMLYSDGIYQKLNL